MNPEETQFLVQYLGPSFKKLSMITTAEEWISLFEWGNRSEFDPSAVGVTVHYLLENIVSLHVDLHKASEQARKAQLNWDYLVLYAQSEAKSEELWRAGLDQDESGLYDAKESAAARVRWWEALDRLFPEIGAACPVPDEALLREWFGEEWDDWGEAGYSDVAARERIYGDEGVLAGCLGDPGESAQEMVEQYLGTLRAAALHGITEPQ